jgi:dTMP kinase
MAGLFISFEGGEGTGKSTQIKLLAQYFMEHGRKVTLTREPGGTPISEAVRAILVNGDPGSLSSTAEALLNYAARDAHLRDVIRPALARSEVVLCDRFMDSTRVYQGIGGDCPMALIDALEHTVVNDTIPSLTFVFDLDPEVGLGRANQRGQGGEDRYELKGLAFHRKVREGFLAVARANPQRCVVLDASVTVDKLKTAILDSVKSRNFQQLDVGNV